MSRSNKLRNFIHSKKFTDFIVTFIISLVFLFLGIFGTASSRNAANEYNNSTDIRNVPAEITYVEYKSKKDEDDATISRYWQATFTYTVDGEEYKGKKKFNSMVSEGEIIEIEVYKNSNGVYKIYEDPSVLDYVLYYAALIVGSVLFIASIVFIMPEKNKKKNG